MTVDEFKSELLKYDVEIIYNQHLLAGEVWILQNLYGDKWHVKYDELKLFISDKLSVHFNDISIAGSAKFGFSINPYKSFKVFNNNSDIDIIIVSQKLFYRFWSAYRRDSYAEIRTESFDKVTLSIFRKYLSADYLDKSNEDYVLWVKQTEGFEKDLQARFLIDNAIHYRIFESWDSAKDYYIHGLKRLKERLEDA